MTVKPIPEGFHTITPFLLVQGAAHVIEFLKKAFGAEERYVMKYSDGKIMHAEVKIGDSIVMLSDANEQWKPMPTLLHLYVKDVDAWYKRAIEAGGVPLREPTTEFYGDRSGGVKDPSGNQWWIATHVEDVPPEEMEKRKQAWEEKKK